MNPVLQRIMADQLKKEVQDLLISSFKEGLLDRDFKIEDTVSCGDEEIAAINLIFERHEEIVRAAVEQELFAKK